MAAPSPEMLTIKPALGFVVMMTCFGIPFVGFGLLVAWIMLSGGVDGMDWLYPIPVVGLGLFLIFEGTTLRLRASQERVWLCRFWHTRWSVARECIELREGRVGDVPFIPGLIVSDRRTGRKVGEIIIHQFPPGPLGRLRADLARQTPGVAIIDGGATQGTA